MLEKLLIKSKQDSTLIQFFRYTFVGGIAFVVDFATLYSLTEFVKIFYLVSASIAFLLGLAVNYLLSTKWVFHNRIIENKWKEFIIFALIGILGLAANNLFIWFFTEIIQVYYLISKIFSTFLVYLWNFFARKLILFR